MHEQKPFLLLTFVIAFALTLPILIQDGMFCDAYLYTSVAKNLAHGEGTFWFPYFDEMNVANLTSFHEQPPLVFWLESLFFRVLGDSLYTERVYTFCMLVLNMLLIKNIWQVILPERKPFYWLGILFWISIPVCFWSFHNCMHENTMSVFCLSAIWLCCLYYFKPKQSRWFLVGAGSCVVLAFMSKGLPGLYALALPVCMWASKQRSFTHMFQDSFILWIIPILFAFFIWFYPTAHQSIIENYMIQRLFQRVGHAPTVTNRLDTLIRLCSELIPAMIVGLLLFLLSKKRTWTSLFLMHEKKVLFFLFLGLCGTLPLMLTTVQKGFYMVAALPCFGIAFGLLYVEVIAKGLTFISQKILNRLTKLAYVLLVIVFGITAGCIGRTSRDQELLHDVYAIRTMVPENTYFELDNKQFDDWSFQNYLMRYNHYGVRWQASGYLVCEKGKTPHQDDQWVRIPIDTYVYDFYKLREE